MPGEGLRRTRPVSSPTESRARWALNQRRETEAALCTQYLRNVNSGRPKRKNLFFPLLLRAAH